MRKTFHNSLEVLLEPLLDDNGIELFLNGKKIWFYLRISTVIADWPEAASYCLTFKSTMSHLPCHFCLVKRDNLADINLQNHDIAPRTHIDMQRQFNQGLGKTVCIEDISNFFWKLP